MEYKIAKKPCKHCGDVRRSSRGDCVNNCAARLWKENNREKHLKYNRQYSADHPELALAWAKNNRDKCNANYAAHVTTAINRMPVWANKEKIAEFYSLAKQQTEETGVKHEVDHIIPLHGETISGLHVPENLQVITCAANRSKSNHFLCDRGSNQSSDGDPDS